MNGLVIHTIRNEAIAVVVEQGGGVRTLQKFGVNRNQRNKSVWAKCHCSQEAESLWTYNSSKNLHIKHTIDWNYIIKSLNTGLYLNTILLFSKSVTSMDFWKIWSRPFSIVLKVLKIESGCLQGVSAHQYKFSVREICQSSRHVSRLSVYHAILQWIT